MAKIGVLTFYGTTDNYGQVLQYLATQEFLNSLGNETYLVIPTGYRLTISRRIKSKIYKILHPFSLFCNKKQIIDCPDEISQDERAKSEIFRQWAEVSKRQEAEHSRCFNQFRTKYFSIQEGTYEAILASGYDAFCVGSDQTWSAGGFEMMLGWVPQKYSRFSIAPSVGHRVYSNDEIASFSKYLQAFDFITVRELKGVKLVEKCGRKDAIKVLDPTFLLSCQEYDKFALSQNYKEPYILIYLLGGQIDSSVKEIVDYCTNKGYKVKYIESQGRNEQLPKIYATVEEWLGLISNASYVITNSFHGMAFSIIYHKPFLVFPLIGLMKGMNGRILDLVKTLSLEDRVFNGDMDVLFKPINWLHADEVIAKNKSLLSKLIKDLNLK